MPEPIEHLPYEEEVEEQANNNPYLFKNFKVAKPEYTRFILFSIMFGIIGFIYSFMRIIKDTYVMVRQDPICIPYIKLFYILPLSFIFVLVVNVMLSSRSVSKIFTICNLFFIVLFFTFGVLVAFEDLIFFSPKHLENYIGTFKLSIRRLGFLKHFLLTLNQPLATLIFITAEMWGTMMLSYLFLSYLNEMCSRRQHGRFIPPLFVVANFSLLLSAFVTTGFFKLRSKFTYEQNMLLMVGVFWIQGCLGIIVLICKYILENRVMKKPIFRPSVLRNNSSTERRSQGSKGGTSFEEGLGVMVRSKFLLAMCTVVFSYSFVFNILETVYKNGVKKGAKTAKVEKGKYSGKLNNVEQYITAISVIIINSTSFSDLIQKKSWGFVALISPLIASFAVIGIIGTAIYNSGADDHSIGIVNKIFSGAKQAIVFENWLGMLLLATLKIFKFTAFDVSKEKISMRIEDGYRPKFKSIYDGIFNKTGKSGGAAFSIFINIIGSTIDVRGMSPITMLILVPSLIFWVSSILYLSAGYEKSIAGNTNIDIDLAEEEEEREEVQEKGQRNMDAQEDERKAAV